MNVVTIAPLLNKKTGRVKLHETSPSFISAHIQHKTDDNEDSTTQEKMLNKWHSETSLNVLMEYGVPSELIDTQLRVVDQRTWNKS